MALLFLDGFDKYGPANSNSTAVAALLTAGEWTSFSGAVHSIVAPLSATGQALQLAHASGSISLTKTLPANYARLIGGFRFSSNLSNNNAGINFLDAATTQCSITINQTAGTISLRAGAVTGTAIATSSASVTANSTHYLEWDLTFSGTGAYQVWLDGVSVFSGTGDLTATANNYANGIGFQAGSSGHTITYDDLYLFDNTGATNNAVLLTSPRIETQFPTGDGAVQFAVGAGILGSSASRNATARDTATNQFRVHPFTPSVAMTLNSISFLASATNASIQLRPVVYGDTAGAPGTLLSGGSVASGVTSGAVKTLPLTTPQALTAGTQYWLGFMCDIAVLSVIAGMDGASTDRTAVSTFASGAPGTAPATISAVSALVWGNVTGTVGNWFSTSQNPTQGSQSYVFDATVGHEDLYTYPALSAPPSAIYAAAVKANVAKSDAGAKTVSVRLKSGATDSAGSAGTALAPGTSYGWLTSHYPTDPNGSVPWTLSALNAAQAGVKVET